MSQLSVCLILHVDIHMITFPIERRVAAARVIVGFRKLLEDSGSSFHLEQSFINPRRQLNTVPPCYWINEIFDILFKR
jgi:hypothetical protein